MLNPTRELSSVYVMLLCFCVCVLLDWRCLPGSDYNIYKKENAEGKVHDRNSAHAMIKFDLDTIEVLLAG